MIALLPYTDCTTGPTVAGRGTPNLDRRTTRRSAVFLRPYAFARLLWAGLGGDGFGRAGVLSSRCSNPVVCPPTPIWNRGAGLTTR